MSLRHSYHLLAPVYDLMVEKPLLATRRRSLARLRDADARAILVNGIGTGLDIPHLPAGASYTGTDITRAMLDIAADRARSATVDLELMEADSMDLPFADESFDHVIMHLILAVVPHPELALQEACRVLRPGGGIYLLDKFLRPGQRAWFRRLLNGFTRHVATRTDVVFEEVLAYTPQLCVVEDEPALAGGWFRLIELRKRN